jgi:hypothetical protein
MHVDADFPYPEWPELARHGIPYEHPSIGRRLARIQTRPESDIAARSVSAVKREIDWMELTGRERIFHPLCGPGNYAAQIRASVGCRWYVGHDVNPAAIRFARRRNRSGPYIFRVARFDHHAAVPTHDLCLLTYETVNVFSPDQLSALFELIAARLRPNGCAFVDVRAKSDPGIPLGVFPPEGVPAGQGIFFGGEHTMEYAARIDHGGRLAVERFRIHLSDKKREFYSWLWLYEEEDIVSLGERAGLMLSRATRLHSAATPSSPGSSSSMQLLFRK